MNLLPFILTFIVLFASVHTAVFHRVTSLAIEENAYASFMSLNRCSRNDYVAKKYKDIRCSKESEAGGSENTDGPKPIGILRTQIRFKQTRRINIYALLADDEPNAFLLSKVCEILNRCYNNLPEYRAVGSKALILFLKSIFDLEHHSSFKELMAKDKPYSGGLNLGKEGQKIRSACKTDDDVDSIESPEEDNAADGDEFCVKNFPNSNRTSIYQNLLERMCKGTQYYCLEKMIGYPPLDDLFRIEKSNAHRPLRWRLAPPMFLRVFFGHELASAILLEESRCAQQGISFGKKALDELLGRSGNDFFADFESARSFLDHACVLTSYANCAYAVDTDGLAQNMQTYLTR